MLAPLATITALDVPRNMGIWYEIAKFPDWFQPQCLRNTSAQYSLQANGAMRVLNRCTVEGGQLNEAVGVA